MSYLRIVLIGVGLAALALAAGFFLQMPWATSRWPLPDTRLSFIFIAAILAGAALPLIWIGASGERRALFSYALGFGVMFAGQTIYGLLLYAAKGSQPLLRYGIFTAVLTAVCGALAAWSRRSPIIDQRLMPNVVRRFFFVEVAVLTLVGIALLFKVPNVLPWSLSAESSVMYGWVFLGLALYFVYPIFNSRWPYTRGQLLGFLAYDLVLIGPFLTRFANVKPEHRLGLIVATAIIIVSGLLAIYYLFLNRATRDWKAERQLEQPVSAQI